MKNYCALLANNVVTQIIVGDYEWATANLDGEWHDLGAEPLVVGVGWIYDADLEKFVIPFSEEE